MSKPLAIDHKNGPSLFVLSRIATSMKPDEFECPIEEYNTYLIEEAWQTQMEFIATTWLLRERTTGVITAYMSLINDAIKLNATEKELHHLNYPFKTIPAMKIAKLAVATASHPHYRGVGSYMIYLARFIAVASNEQHSACRFLTVDADIEHDPNVTIFYTKNGFIPNGEMNKKHGKTISMRKDILL